MPRLRGSSTVVVFLSCVWLLLFVYYEHIVPYRRAAQCKWAQLEKQTNVLFVADPQLIDSHTYPGRNSLLLKVSQHTVDLYLKQNYKALIKHLRPDYVMFLGDYLDNGRLCLNDYYENEFRRFERIFNRFPQYVRGKNLFTSVPGNHDIGFGNGVKPELQARFASHFGKPNTVETINGVDFIMLDTPSFSSEAPEIRKNAAQFVNSLPAATNPRILLSHIPFFRDPGRQQCGPFRERNPFLQIAGYQYQLAISPDLLKELLEKIKPQLMFAGDDHDYCDILHESGARDIAVKSISMAMGIKYPAVQLLSYTAKDQKMSYDTHICYLPRPYVNVFAYILMAIVSATVIILWDLKQRSSRYNYSMIPVWSLERTSTDLPEEQEGISQKVFEFMANLDKSSDYIPLPNYTFTPRTWEKRCEKALLSKKQSFIRVLRKWNVLMCARHLVILAFVAMTTYKLVIMFV